MSHGFPAIYENGVLKPLTPLPLAEHDRVWVEVSLPPSKQKDPSAIIELQRRAAEELDAEMDLLPDNSPEDGESFYDAAARLGIIGSIHDTPPDLSTNTKYFEGFGKRDS